ncbi:glycosyltransferase family 4 protein [Candidatus Daviesbacteria bacterium]|nr:glycosyltransferase family 4 protein [Candidatus Daviesbacteria bacterium]
MSDGSIFYPTAKKNILHIQSPIIGQPAKSIWGKFKLKGWDLIIYNSKFTKEYSQANWPLKSEIIFPPIDTAKIRPLKKEKYILSVGRFFGYLKDKKQEILIRVFKELFKKENMKGWSLHLVGSAEPGDADYIESLKASASGIPVKFYPNLSYEKLIELYGKAGIYWHASGFGETDPTKMEHFGISTVEAMAGGAVPVVIGKGGQREIIADEKYGYLWENLDELKQLTLKLIEDSKLLGKMSKEAIKRAEYFSKEKFTDRIMQIIK